MCGCGCGWCLILFHQYHLFPFITYYTHSLSICLSLLSFTLSFLLFVGWYSCFLVSCLSSTQSLLFPCSSLPSISFVFSHALSELTYTSYPSFLALCSSFFHFISWPFSLGVLCSVQCGCRHHFHFMDPHAALSMHACPYLYPCPPSSLPLSLLHVASRNDRSSRLPIHPPSRPLTLCLLYCLP